MKVETILSLIKLPEGVEFDLNSLDLNGLTDEWNRQYNGMKKAYGEEVETKTKQDLLSRYGLEKEEDIKALKDNKETNVGQENEKLSALEEQLKTLQSNLNEKDAQLERTTNLGLLSKLGIKEERLEKAYKLIASDVNEETDFKSLADQFVKDTPEWLGKGRPAVDFNIDKHGDNDNKDQDAETIENAW